MQKKKLAKLSIHFVSCGSRFFFPPKNIGTIHTSLKKSLMAPGADGVMSLRAAGTVLDKVESSVWGCAVALETGMYTTGRVLYEYRLVLFGVDMDEGV